MRDIIISQLLVIFIKIHVNCFGMYQLTGEKLHLIEENSVNWGTVAPHSVGFIVDGFVIFLLLFEIYLEVRLW